MIYLKDNIIELKEEELYLLIRLLEIFQNEQVEDITVRKNMKKYYNT